MRWSSVSLTVSGLFLGMTPCLHGEVIPIDDFEHKDSSLPGWTLADLSSEPWGPATQPWGPGVYDPSSGALRIYHSGSAMVPPDTPFNESAMFALWNNSATDKPRYSNGYLQAKIRIDEPNANAALEMRANLPAATAYLLFGNTHPHLGLQGGIELHKFDQGVETTLWQSANDGIELLPGENWNLELGVVGSRISARVWKVGDVEPALPQFSMIDPHPLPAGMIGISSDKILGVDVDARADATFDDIVFVSVPEPSSLLLLLAVGTLAIAICRRA